MIDPHWSLVDLDPRTWRAIGRFFDPGQYLRTAQPGEHGLFVLHDGGRILRVVDTERGVRHDLGLPSADDPQALAAQLYAQGEWQRVHVIDKQHLAGVAREIQRTPQRDLLLDQYYHRLFRLLWANPHGYVSVPAHPGHWHGWTYAALQACVARLPDPATVALAVVDGATLDIGLIAELRGGRIRVVTTFDAFGLPPPAFDLSAESFARLWSLLEERSHTLGTAPPAAALLCSPRTFETWLCGPAELSPLTRLTAQGEAFWQWGLRIAP